MIDSEEQNVRKRRERERRDASIECSVRAVQTLAQAPDSCQDIRPHAVPGLRLSEIREQIGEFGHLDIRHLLHQPLRERGQLQIRRL